MNIHFYIEPYWEYHAELHAVQNATQSFRLQDDELMGPQWDLAQLQDSGRSVQDFWMFLLVSSLLSAELCPYKLFRRQMNPDA